MVAPRAVKLTATATVTGCLPGRVDLRLGGLSKSPRHPRPLSKTRKQRGRHGTQISITYSRHARGSHLTPSEVHPCFLGTKYTWIECRTFFFAIEKETAVGKQSYALVVAISSAGSCEPTVDHEIKLLDSFHAVQSHKDATTVRPSPRGICIHRPRGG